VLVYVHRQDSARHSDWLNQILSSDATFGVSDLVLSGFLRVVTHPRVFGDPTSLHLALRFAESLRHHPNAVDTHSW